MNDFRASLACVLLVLRQLCLTPAIENNLSVVKLRLTMEALKRIFSSVNK
jgi:hypothetical protein